MFPPSLICHSSIKINTTLTGYITTANFFQKSTTQLNQTENVDTRGK